MEEKQLYTILKVIKHNSNVKQLTREGLTLSKIAELISFVITEGYVIYSENHIELSKKGLEKFNELDKKYKKIKKEDWIEEDIKSKIPKLDKNVLFLPRQNELTF